MLFGRALQIEFEFVSLQTFGRIVNNSFNNSLTKAKHFCWRGTGFVITIDNTERQMNDGRRKSALF